jgi:integrase
MIYLVFSWYPPTFCTTATPSSTSDLEPFRSLFLPRISLADATIRALKPTGKQETYWCNLTPNFALRMSQKGGKSFFVMLGRERKRIHLGKYPGTSLKHARERARALLINPAARSNGKTLAEAFDAFFQSAIQPNYKPRSAIEARRTFDRYMDTLAGRPVAAITTSDLSALFPRLAHTPSGANHLYKLLRTFFRHAVQHGVVIANPLTFPKPYKEVSRERVLADDELIRVYRAAVEMGSPFGYMVLLCIHCGYRIGEVAAMKWSYITTEYITLPAEIYKTGREHVLPNLISKNLALIPRTSEYVFPSRAGTSFVSFSLYKRRIDRLSCVTDWTLHDLRRTFSSKCAEWQVASPDIIERLLGHTTALSTIARIYNRWHYLPQMRVALEKYEEKLAQLLAS